jgi:nitroreductase
MRVGHDRNMDLIEAIRNRRSTASVTDEAPTDEELAGFVALAAHAPDHASLRPWRLATVRGDARVKLGLAWAEGFGDDLDTPEGRKTANKPMRAPLLVGVVAQLQPNHPKVPEWEQLAAIAALVTTLELVLFDAGYTAMWRTGPAVELAPVKDFMQIGPDERLLGWLYVGRTADPEADLGDRGDPDVSGKISSVG